MTLAQRLCTLCIFVCAYVAHSAQHVPELMAAWCPIKALVCREYTFAKSTGNIGFRRLAVEDVDTFIGTKAKSMRTAPAACEVTTRLTPLFMVGVCGVRDVRLLFMYEVYTARTLQFTRSLVLVIAG